MKTNERFLAALKNMNSIMKDDVKAGRKWRYSNSSSKQAHTFKLARQKGKRYTNCVLAIWWGLREAGVPDSALHWMGGVHKIVWTASGAKAAAQKYFKIISTGGKTVQQLWDKGLLCDGDILMGFPFTHTCVFYGGSTGKKSFDAGHAYCSGGGELALFKKWIGSLTCKSNSTQYIFRLKDRAHWRAQAGAYASIAEYNAQVKRIKDAMGKDFKVEQKFEDGMYKVQCDVFDGRSNCDRLVAKLKAKGIDAFSKEL